MVLDRSGSTRIQGDEATLEQKMRKSGVLLFGAKAHESRTTVVWGVGLGSLLVSVLSFARMSLICPLCSCDGTLARSGQSARSRNTVNTKQQPNRNVRDSGIGRSVSGESRRGSCFGRKTQNSRSGSVGVFDWAAPGGVLLVAVYSLMRIGALREEGRFDDCGASTKTDLWNQARTLSGLL